MYLISEAKIAIPDSWKDRTMNMFVPEHGEGSLVITRDDMQPSETFSEYVVTQLKKLSSMPGYLGADAKKLSVSGRPAYMHEYKWENEQAEIHQILTIVDIGGRVLALTRSSALAFDEAQRRQLDDILISMELTPRM